MTPRDDIAIALDEQRRRVNRAVSEAIEALDALQKIEPIAFKTAQSWGTWRLATIMRHVNEVTDWAIDRRARGLPVNGEDE